MNTQMIKCRRIKHISNITQGIYVNFSFIESLIRIQKFCYLYLKLNF